MALQVVHRGLIGTRLLILFPSSGTRARIVLKGHREWVNAAPTAVELWVFFFFFFVIAIP